MYADGVELGKGANELYFVGVVLECFLGDAGGSSVEGWAHPI